MTKKELAKIYKDYNLTKDDIYQDRRGFVIITRSGIEKIQFDQNIKIEFDVLKCELDNVVIKAITFSLTRFGNFKYTNLILSPENILSYFLSNPSCTKV